MSGSSVNNFNGGYYFMKLLKRSLCLLLVAVFAITLMACGGKTETADGNPSSSEEEKNWRPNPEKVEKVEFVDTDGDFDYTEASWDGPEGYVIVVPAGDIEAKKSATALQEYFAATSEITLKIVTDKTAEIDKEILVGKTNRSASPRVAWGTVCRTRTRPSFKKGSSKAWARVLPIMAVELYPRFFRVEGTEMTRSYIRGSFSGRFMVIIPRRAEKTQPKSPSAIA